LAGAGVLFWYMRDRWGRGPLAGVSIFIITLSPMLGFINYYTMRYSFVADHYQYLASLGLIAVVVEGVRWGFRRWSNAADELTSRRAVMVEKSLGVVVLVILGILTWNQTHIYRDSETLWQDTLRKNPQSWMAYNNLGVFVTKQGKLDQGIEYFRNAIAINPEHLEAHNNLGGAYTKKGNLDQAIAAYEQALTIIPNHPKTHNNLGIVYAKLNRLDNAIVEYEKALSHSPRYVEAHYNLGNVYTKYGRFDEAITSYKQALALKPLHAEALTNLGAAYLNSDRVDEAVIQFKRALAIKPGLLNARTNLAYSYYLQGNYQLSAFECDRIKKMGYRVPPQLLEMLKPHLSREN
jgi:tetratricopeptide (TPR) repeat protein